jgi:flagellar basal-body rod protein FlgG
MNPVLWTAKTGLESQQQKLAIIANNISNVNTSGFKRSRGVFEDLLYQNLKQPGSQSSEGTEHTSGIMIGTGTTLVANPKDFSQGSLQKTDGQFDIAIEGNGFFRVAQPDGTEAYTRDGSFTVNKEGTLVTNYGYQVLPAITIPQNTTDVSIADDGRVVVEVGGVQSVVGRITLTGFISPKGLKPLGHNLFVQTTSSGEPVESNAMENGMGNLRQGFIEASNVSVVEEMVGMIETQRAYELSSKAVSAADEMMRTLNQVV